MPERYPRLGCTLIADRLNASTGGGRYDELLILRTGTTPWRERSNGSIAAEADKDTLREIPDGLWGLCKFPLVGLARLGDKCNILVVGGFGEVVLRIRLLLLLVVK